MNRAGREEKNVIEKRFSQATSVCLSHEGEEDTMPHRSMSIEQLEAMMQNRQRLWIFLYTSEAVVAAMLLAWAVQLAQRQEWQFDPISAALKQFTPFIAPRVHGFGLIALCFCHILFMVRNIPGWRRNCIFFEMGFLFFVEYVLILAFFYSHLFIPGLYGVPVLIFFSFLNFVSLIKPQPKTPQETGECPTDN